MNDRRSRCLTLAGVAAGAMAALFMSFAFAATEAQRNVSDEIARAKASIVAAEVWLVPPGRESRYAITEQDLPTNACSYHATDQAGINALVEVLAKAGLVQQQTPPDPHPVAIAIYLTLEGGRSLTLVATPEYTNAPVSGVFNRQLAVVAKPGFEADMWRWARARRSTRDVGLCRKQQF